MTAIAEVIFASGSMENDVQIVVCVPAFRRPDHLRQTLASVASQQTTRRFAVVIVENDAVARSSIAEAKNFLETSGIPGVCIVEPNQGNCYAINTAFSTATSHFPTATMLMMIDDDEVASPTWLQLMSDAAQSSGADVIGGPVFPHFEDRSKCDLERHPAFRPAYDVSGPVPIIYGSGNCLIMRRVFDTLAQPAFDLRFNFLGGGDTDFFTRCQHAGLTFHWVGGAAITETVPDGRTQPGWLAARGLRIGAINYQIRAKLAHTTLARARLLARVAASLPLSVWRACRLAVTERHILIAVHPVIVAAGGALAAMGIEPQPYKAKSA